MDALPEFNPLFILRYSATHSTQHNVVHRLDAVDAYNQKLVKKIAVRGIQTRGLAGTSAYLYLESIEISKHAPVARIDMQVQLQSGVIKQQVKTVRHGDDLFELSNQLNAYQDRYVVSQIDAVAGEVHFVNGEILTVGNAIGDVTEEQLRRIQIRETVLASPSPSRSLAPSPSHHVSTSPSCKPPTSKTQTTSSCPFPRDSRSHSHSCIRSHRNLCNRCR